MSNQQQQIDSTIKQDTKLLEKGKPRWDIPGKRRGYWPKRKKRGTRAERKLKRRRRWILGPNPGVDDLRTINTISVDIADFMEELIDTHDVPAKFQGGGEDKGDKGDLDWTEPAYYHVQKARMLEYIWQWEYVIYYYNRALRKIESLHINRLDIYPLYQCMLAPFYFKLGYAIASYMEANTDKDGYLKPLVIPKNPWKKNRS